MCEDVKFKTEDGVTLRGWYYVPEDAYEADFATASGAAVKWFVQYLASLAPISGSSPEAEVIRDPERSARCQT